MELELTKNASEKSFKVNSALILRLSNYHYHGKDSTESIIKNNKSNEGFTWINDYAKDFESQSDHLIEINEVIGGKSGDIDNVKGFPISSILGGWMTIEDIEKHPCPYSKKSASRKRYDFLNREPIERKTIRYEIRKKGTRKYVPRSFTVYRLNPTKPTWRELYRYILENSKKDNSKLEDWFLSSSYTLDVCPEVAMKYQHLILITKCLSSYFQDKILGRRLPLAPLEGSIDSLVAFTKTDEYKEDYKKMKKEIFGKKKGEKALGFKPSKKDASGEIESPKVQSPSKNNPFSNELQVESIFKDGGEIDYYESEIYL